MDRYKIERYFTSIGRSFYSGEEYEDLGISYKPISNFGIGFLSSFMVCREIDVKTKYYIENSEGLKLHIPNYDGCFFIELDKNTNIGTEIKLYMNSDINDKGIVDYIRYVEENAKKERNKWIGHLRRHEIKINYPLEENANHHNIQASKKTLMRLIEETAHRNVMYTYTIDGRTRYEIERLIKEIVGELQMEDDRKFIFKVLSVMLLNMTDKVIGNSYKKEPGVVFALKSALLQYFCIGQEEKQEMRIMYDELREVRELFNE